MTKKKSPKLNAAQTLREHLGVNKQPIAPVERPVVDIAADRKAENGVGFKMVDAHSGMGVMLSPREQVLQEEQTIPQEFNKDDMDEICNWMRERRLPIGPSPFSLAIPSLLNHSLVVPAFMRDRLPEGGYHHGELSIFGIGHRDGDIQVTMSKLRNSLASRSFQLNMEADLDKLMTQTVIYDEPHHPVKKHLS